MYMHFAILDGLYWKSSMKSLITVTDISHAWCLSGEDWFDQIEWDIVEQIDIDDDFDCDPDFILDSEQESESEMSDTEQPT